MSSTRRMLTEKRALLMPLFVVLGLNLLVSGLVVYPMSRRVASAAARSAAATRHLGAAQRAETEAQETVAGKQRAEEDLQTFYAQVLPTDLTGARRLTYLRLAQLAQQTDLKYERRTTTEGHERESQLAKLSTTMVLEGEYENVRRFIHELETIPEFVVIEDVTLAQSEEQAAPLVLTLEVATYYRAGDDGS